MRLTLLFLLLPACLGFLLLAPTDGRAQSRLVEQTRALAEQGDPEAQFSLGLLHDTGNQVAHDPQLAAQWFARAAHQGLAGAGLYLGMKYEFGSGVEMDRDKARYWYRQAALQGWGQAAYMLGSLLLNSVPPDPVRGCAWLCIAEDQGYPRAGKLVHGPRCTSESAAAGPQAEKIQQLCRELAGQIKEKTQPSPAR
jgi:TPR repeat protein